MRNSCEEYSLRVFSAYIYALFISAALLALPADAWALTPRYIDPGYSFSVFATIGVSIDALEVDSAGSIFVVDNSYWGTGTVFIDRYDAADSYVSASIYTSYTPKNNHANGMVFDGLGNMYTIECSGKKDSGVIHKIDNLLATETYYKMWNICPTGIAADTSGNLFITGRSGADLLFGNIYALDADKELKVVVPDFVGEGIALDRAGNIFAVNWLDNSLYMFEAETYTPFLIATFDIVPDGVSVDAFGNIYVFENTGYGDPRPTPILRFAPVVRTPVLETAPEAASARQARSR